MLQTQSAGMGLLCVLSWACEAPPPLAPPGPVQRVQLTLLSPADADLGCHGADRSPALSWSSLAGAPYAALVVQSRQAGGGPAELHWQAWDLTASPGQLSAGIRPGQSPPIQGLSGGGKVGWQGPCAPPGSTLMLGIEIWLLDAQLAAPPTLELDALRARAAPHLRGFGDLQIAFSSDAEAL